MLVGSRAAFVACIASTAVLPADGALSPFNFFALSHIIWHSLLDESPHLFTARTHPSLLNTRFYSPSFPVHSLDACWHFSCSFGHLWPQAPVLVHCSFSFGMVQILHLPNSLKTNAVLRCLLSLRLSMKLKRAITVWARTELYLFKFSHNAQPKLSYL